MSVTAGGVIAGFSVGAGAGQNIFCSKGASTMYASTVESLDPERAEDVYNVQLLTYSYRDQDGKREFEVINYWVGTEHDGNAGAAERTATRGAVVCFYSLLLAEAGAAGVLRAMSF